MVNVIGVEPDPSAVLAVPGAHLHRYGKAARPERKMGHVTVVGVDAQDRDDRLAAVRRLASGLTVRPGVIAIRRAMRSSVDGWVENRRAMSTPRRGDGPRPAGCGSRPTPATG